MKDLHQRELDEIIEPFITNIFVAGTDELGDRVLMKFIETQFYSEVDYQKILIILVAPSVAFSTN